MTFTDLHLVTVKIASFTTINQNTLLCFDYEFDMSLSYSLPEFEDSAEICFAFFPGLQPVLWKTFVL